MRQMLLVIVFLVVAASQAKANRDKVFVIDSTEVVSRQWKSDRCDDNDIPDMPARVFVDDHARTRIIATHYDNRVLLLRDNGSLASDECRIVLKSGKDAVSTNYADHSWLASVWTWDGKTVHAVVHHEYQAHRHPGACSVNEYVACWFNTLTSAISHDGGRTFTQSVPPVVIASAPFPQEYGQGRHRGFFEPTNIVHHDGYLYFLAHTTGWSGQRDGYCLFRTGNIANPNSWYSWDGQQFSAQFPASKEERIKDSARCLPVIGGRVGSILWVDELKAFVATAIGETGNSKLKTFAVTLSYSRDLLHWSKPEVLLDIIHGSSSSCGDKYRYMYPSMVNHRDSDGNMKTYLYLTRTNVINCTSTLDRDLVRHTLKLIEVAR